MLAQRENTLWLGETPLWQMQPPYVVDASGEMHRDVPFSITWDALRCNISVTFNKPVAARSLEVPMRWLIPPPQYLDRAYRWQPWTVGAQLDRLTPLAFTTPLEDSFLHVQGMGHGAVILGAGGSYRILLDHAALRPPRPLIYQPGESLSCHFQFILSPIPAIPLLWRYPDARQAAFAITDHADWDTTAKWATLHPALGQIRITKSVFSLTRGYATAEKTFQPDGLDVPAFNMLMETLHAAGHEICPHAIAPRPAPDALAVGRDKLLMALDDFARRFQSATWIDHGLREPFNYSQQGWDQQSEWYLLDALSARGFSSLWAYHDTARYPVRQINQLATPDHAGLYWRKALTQPNSAGLNYLKIAAEMHLGTAEQKHLQRLAALAKSVLAGDYTPRARAARLGMLLREMPPRLAAVLLGSHTKKTSFSAYPTLYPERHSDLFLFTSVLVNNLNTAWRNLPQLIAEHGLHIAHTYLCHSSPYTEPALDKTGQITADFRATLAQIEEHLPDLWNPTMREMVAWFKGWQALRLTPNGERQMLLHNPTDMPLAGVTLWLPDQFIRVDLKPQEVHPITW